MLAVGLELAGLSTAWPEHWRRLITRVRAIYPGRLTYCANWWGELGQIDLWKRLDLIGVQAFQPLSDDPRASDAALRAGARRAVDVWREEARRHGRPLLAGEL